MLHQEVKGELGKLGWLKGFTVRLGRSWGSWESQIVCHEVGEELGLSKACWSFLLLFYRCLVCVEVKMISER